MPVFSINRLLLWVAFAGIVFAVWTQVGFEGAEFQISENELQLNEDYLVAGELWGYMGEELPSKNQWAFVCEIRNAERTALLNLKAGKKNRIRFRSKPIWPLKKQDAFRVYLTKTLGFRSNQIIGFVRTNKGTKVVIDGSR